MITEDLHFAFFVCLIRANSSLLAGISYVNSYLLPQSSCLPHLCAPRLYVVQTTRSSPGQQWNAAAERFQDKISLETQKERAGGRRHWTTLCVNASGLWEGRDVQLPSPPLCRSKTKSRADILCEYLSGSPYPRVYHVVDEKQEQAQNPR